MKRLIALSGFTIALLCGPGAIAQSSPPPPLPQLTPEQSQTLEQRLDAYRQQTQARVSHGEITSDEADRLIAWREWQIARQLAGTSSGARPGNAPPEYNAPDDNVPPDYKAPPDYNAPPTYTAPTYTAPPANRDYVVVEPAPYYVPYYRYPAPYYYAPRPYYWGPAFCAGGFGHHFGGRICF